MPISALAVTGVDVTVRSPIPWASSELPIAVLPHHSRVVWAGIAASTTERKPPVDTRAAVYSGTAQDGEHNLGCCPGVGLESGASVRGREYSRTAVTTETASPTRLRRTSTTRSPGRAIVPGPHVEPDPGKRIAFRSLAEDPTCGVGSGVSDRRNTRVCFVRPVPGLSRVPNLPSSEAVVDRVDERNRHEGEHGIVRFVGLNDLRVVNFVHGQFRFLGCCC